MAVKRLTILVLGLVAVFGIAALAFDAWRTYNRALAAASKEAQNLVTVLEDHTTRTIQAVDQALEGLAANTDTLVSPTADPDAIKASFQQRLSNLPQLLWFTVVDVHGDVIASSDKGVYFAGNKSALGWFSAYRDPAQFAAISDHSVFGKLLRGRITGRWLIPITRALKSADGTFRGVIVAALDPQYFANLYSRIDTGPHGSVSLYEKDGTIVARYPGHSDFIGRSVGGGTLFPRYVAKANSGVVRLNAVLTHRDLLVAYKTLANYPLVINVSYDERDIFADWKRSLVIYGLLALGIVGFAVLSGVALTRGAEHAKALALAQTEAETARSARREISRVERSLANAQRIANIGNWEWNIETNELIWSDQIYRIFGFAPREFSPSYPAFLERVHPDDRALVEEAVGSAFADGVPYDVNHRILRSDGAVRIVREQGEIIRDRAGNAVWMSGVCQDITELRLAEDARHKSETRLAGILGIAPEAIIAVDKAGIIQIFNRGAEAIFGYASAEAVGKPLDILLPERFRITHAALMRAFGDEDEPSRLMSRRGRISGRRKDGIEFPAEASIAKLDMGDERLFTVILRDITDRVEAERTLIAAKDEAELANRTKSEFLANMSHELRTPLNAIIGFSEMMSRQQFGALGDPHYKEYAVAIHDSGTHLLRIINHILDVSKIETGRMEIEESEIDLERIAFESLSFIRQKADQSGISLQIAIAPSLPMLLADELKIKQIAINLLSNAIKFTPRGGTVRVMAGLNVEGEPTLSISDTGIGIPPERLANLGKPFVQVDSGLNRRFEGTGLGLALSRALAELHGGSLDIASQVGCGTTVIVRLPRQRIVDRPKRVAAS